MQISASQLRNFIQVRFNVYLIFHLYIYLIVFKVITGLFFVANFHSSTDLETKISTDFTTYKVASLQRFFHWRSQRTFGIAVKNPRSVFKTVDYWLQSHSL